MEYIGFEDSKNLKFALYDSNSDKLYMYFRKPSLYVYEDFTKENFEMFKSSEEKGKYFYDNIRSKHNYKLIY